MTLAPPSVGVDLRVAIAGTELVGDARRRLVATRVRHVMSRPSVAEVLLDGREEQGADIEPGCSLEIHIGDHLHLTGDVASVQHHHDASGGHLIRVRGFDRLARLRRMQGVRALPSGDLPSIVRSIVGEVGLDVSSTGTWPRLDRLHQYRENDLATLVELAHLYGAGLVVRGTTVHVVGIEGLGEAVDVQLGADLLDVTHGRNDGAADEVRATGWDHERGEVMAVDGRASGALPSLGTTLSSTAVRHLRDIGAPDADAASAQARAVAERDEAASRTFRATVTRRADLSVGQSCTFRDGGGSVIGSHRLEVVDHQVTGTGVVTEVSSRAPRRRHAATSASTTGVARGVVVDVADPDGRGRVRVSLPTFGEAVSPWVDVVHAGGSGERGFVAVPRVDDLVALLVVEGDLSRSVVLGGLLGPAGPVRDVVEGGDVVRHAWHSDPDQYVVLDSAASTVSMRNRTGSRIELTPELVEVHAASDLVIAAPGKRISIRAAAIDFEQVEEAET